MAYTASNSTLTTTMTRNGEPFGPLEATRLGANFTDFRVDALAISSYSDERADGSILAHGTVDNMVMIYAQEPMVHMTGRYAAGAFEARFISRTNWQYQLEHTPDLVTWTSVGPFIAGNGEELMLSHHSKAPHGFYRLRAERP